MTATTGGSKKALLLVIIGQWLCTSVWFAGSSVFIQISQLLHLNSDQGAFLLMAVELGFVVGTLFYASFRLSDKYSPTLVFFVSSLLLALVNVLPLAQLSWESVLLSRLFCGFFLAGIYPVGIKILADRFPIELGKTIAWLVAALVFGSAFPYLIQYTGGTTSVSGVLKMSSLAAILGGLMIFTQLPEVPRKINSSFRFLAGLKAIWTEPFFVSSAKGYFGHMWELYTFWGILPLVLHELRPEVSIPLVMILVFVFGILACIAVGQLFKRFGAPVLARTCLTTSGICCLVSPLVLTSVPTFLLLAFLCLWGAAVIGDSPMFSTLVAQYAPSHSQGSAITWVNGIGFLITVVSLLVLKFWISFIPMQYAFLILAVGPVYGLLNFRLKIKELH